MLVCGRNRNKRLKDNLNLDIKYFLNDSLKPLIIFLQELENDQMTMMKSMACPYLCLEKTLTSR